MNKKGFTLVEMLVVIAIIAVLVAIIVPTAVGATKKASAATDAANLRSTMAQLATWYLTEGSALNAEGATKSTGNLGANASIKFGDIDTNLKAPACKSNSGDKFNVSFDGTEFTVKFGSHGIDYYAGIADGSSSN